MSTDRIRILFEQEEGRNMNRATAFRTVIDRTKAEEQKTIMKKITNEEDYMIEAISAELLRASDDFDTYLYKLCEVNKLLLQGNNLSQIIQCLQGNRYLSCGGENYMAMMCTTNNGTDVIIKDNKLYVRLRDIEITHEKTKSILSENIRDINIIVPNKVVEVTFADGLKEKMVCHKDDTFNLRNCLFIAIAKHLYKKKYTFEGIEWKAFEMTHLKKYVKIVDSALKAFEKKQKDITKLEADRKAELESIERKRTKRQAYKERRTAKREQTEKEKQIEIQKEAYIQAMKAMEENKGV